MFNRVRRRVRASLFSAWVLAGSGFAILICEPISLQAHFVMGGAALLAMALINLLHLGGPWRQLFVALGSGIVFRYFYWRTTSTIPPSHDWPSFACGVILWAAEAYSIAMLAISLFVVASPIRRRPAERLAADAAPTVDVFIPTYNEDKDLLTITLAAATAMDYPADRLRVHLLDDGGTDQKCQAENPAAAEAARRRRADLQQLAADLGATYHTRAENLHAKAGNMNAALDSTDGELIAVFDADHVPMPDFLQETVGYFRQDDRLFLCQTPHIFSNPDPIERNLRTFAVMPSENEMFYSIVQRGLDKWNAAFFCGSAAVLRRSALATVGGFSGISITEDCETALDLHAHGWNSLYIDKPLISGLQPETFASFIGQRSRWARGMFQIFLLKNPLLKRHLSLAQRICYLSNMSYWFFPLFRLPFLIAPFLYIWFSLQIYVASFHEFFAYTSVYMVANFLLQNYLYGTVRWPLVSELYEYVQSIYLSRGLVSVIANPRRPTFNVTDKGQTLDKDFLSELAWPYFAIFAAVLASQVYATVRLLTEPAGNDLLAVVSAWNFLNLLLTGAALGVVAERRSEQREIGKAVDLAIGPALVPAVLVTLSPRGCRVRLQTHLGSQVQPGTAGVLDVHLSRRPAEARTLPVILGSSATGAEHQLLDLVFPALRAEHYRLIAAILHPGSAHLLAARSRRQGQKSILGGLWTFASWGLREPWRGFASLVRHLRPEAEAKVARVAPPRAEPVLSMPVATGDAADLSRLTVAGQRN